MSRSRMDRSACAAIVGTLVVTVLSGCLTTPPPSRDASLATASMAPSAPELTPVPGAASVTGVGGTVACQPIDICVPVIAALDGTIPEPMPADQVLVIAPGCPEGDDCVARINAFAILVPATWRLGDALTAAWTVQGVEGSLRVAPWTRGSLPENVLPVVRAAVEGG